MNKKSKTKQTKVRSVKKPKVDKPFVYGVTGKISYLRDLRAGSPIC